MYLNKTISLFFIPVLFLTGSISVFAVEGASKAQDGYSKYIPTTKEIVALLMEREDSKSVESSFKEISGNISAVYSNNQAGVANQIVDSHAFAGTSKIALQMKVNDVTYDLLGLQILDSDQKILVGYDSKKILELKSASRYGLLVRIVTTKNASAENEINLYPNYSKPLGSAPDTNYISLKTAFSDPSEILNSDKIDETLEKLKSIQTATEQYHQDLLNLVIEAESIDVDHLNLLLDAFYYSLADYEQLQKSYNKFRDEKNVDQKIAVGILTEIRLAEKFSNYSNQILVAGLPKTKDITLDSATDLLARLYPIGMSSNVYNYILKKFRPQISIELKIKFKELAKKKKQNDIAIKLGLELFKKNSDLSIKSLIALANEFSFYDKDVVAKKGLAIIDAVSADDLIKLSTAVYSERNQLILNNLEKVSDLDLANTIKISKSLNFNDTDAVINNYINLGNAMSTSDAIALANASYSLHNEILLNNFSRLTDSSLENTLTIAKQLNTYDKDNVILAFLAKQESPSTQMLIKLADASYSRHNDILLNNFSKVSDYTLENTLAVAKLLLTYDKDRIILSYLGKLTNPTTQTLITLSDASYAERSSILMLNFRKTSDMSVANTITIAGKLVTFDKDALIEAFLKMKVRRISTAELLSLSDAAYLIKTELLMKNISKVSDLTVENALKIVSRLNLNDKDTFLMTAVDLVTDLSAANSNSLSKAGYASQDEILQAATDRLSDQK